MIKNLMMAVLGVWCLVLGASGALKDELPDDYGLKVDLTSATQPGTALKNNTIYTVRGHVLINAKANAGMSALKVPIGASAVIEIPEGNSLTVIGGDAEEMIGAGAGIEVPMGAKLVICGEGKLTAIGGSAAPGENGHRGLNGEVTPVLDLKTFPMDAFERGDIGIGDALGSMIGVGKIAEALESILFVGKGGTGGAGGAGGGGAAAGIGGKGGRGGKGGAETEGQRVVPGSQWAKRQQQFEQWFETLGWGHPFTYGYSTWNLKSKARNLNGTKGSRGAKGASGMACGEIIIAESVKISAQPGFAAPGGKNGRCGKPYSTYDMNHDNTQITDFIVMGIEIASDIAVTVMSGGANKAVEAASAAGGGDDDDEEADKDKDKDKDDEEEEDDDDDEEEDDTTQKLWFYGGGGGGGGAGGAAALKGIGPGGAGGGGGGSGGSGLFIVGSNLGSPWNAELGLEANGHGGLGGASYVPEGADIEAVRAASFGKDASALNNGESAGVLGDRDKAEDECFNLYVNQEAIAFWKSSGLPEHANDRTRLGCWTTNYEHDHFLAPELTDDCFAYAGLPGLGGKAGTVPLNYLIYKSPDASVANGLDASKTTNYSGKVFCKLKLVLGEGQSDSEDWFVCGTAVSPVLVPVGSKIFAGFFTKPDGKGLQYFDKFGNPSGFPFIAGDTTLYAHWVTEDVDLGIRECKYVTDRNLGKVGTTLETGRVYYFTEDIERDANAVGMRCAGICLEDNPGGTVVFYIPEGVTVSFGGANGMLYSPGYAGIEVPAGVTLVVTGEGTLNVTGGNAGAAEDGWNGGDGGYTYVKGLGQDYVTGGTGSRGGYGAGGAAAAIGGSGGKGGFGGDMTAGNHVNCWGGDTKKNGNNGTDGNVGVAGGACGNVSIVGTVAVDLQGGLGTFGGAGGKVGGRRDDTGSGNAQNYTGTGGGGGGGGGGSCDALTIGGGQGGGGGGGGGGSGSTMNNDIEDIDGGDGEGGKGGLASCATGTIYGDEGNPNGTSGNPKDAGYHREVFGGNGGAGGSGGATGDNGSYTRGLKLDVIAPDFGDREELMDTDYVFGHPALQRTITFTYHGETLGTVLAMMGEPLPTVIVDQLLKVKGFDFAGAYLVDTDGLPVLDDFGFEDWWYDEFGYGEKTYNMPGDVTLEVHMEPRWYVMAKWPDAPDFVYDGKAKRVLESVDPDAGFEVVGGTLVATNAGIYFARLRLKDGYEVWSDADWNYDDEVTNVVRSWMWSIQPAEVDVTFANQTYDWNATTNGFCLTGELPKGTKASFILSGMYAPGVYEVTAQVYSDDEDWNYWPKCLTSVYTIPEALALEGVLPFYPWDTGVAVDFTLVDEFADSVLTRYTNLTLRATMETEGYVDLFDTNSVAILETVAVTNAALGYGTLVGDFADAFPNYRGKAYLWLAIDDVPASEVVEVAIDTTATADPMTGVPVYAIENVNDILPINYSWRFANEKWDYNDPVRLSLGGTFAPVGEQGYSSNEGAADFTPTANGRHKVGLMIGQPDEKSHYSKGEFTAFFEVNDPNLAGGGSPGVPGKVIRNEESGESSSRYGSYSTLAEAIAAYEYGDLFYVYGDVQGEAVEIPSGATVLLVDAAAKIRPPEADTARPWLAAAPVRDAAGNIYGYALGCNGEMVKVGFGPDENGEFFRYEVSDDVTNIVFSVTNTYYGLYYSVDYKLNDSDDWLDGELTPGSNGVTYVSAPYLGAEALYSPRVTDDPTVYPPLTYEENEDGTYTVTGVKVGASVSGLLKVPSVRRGKYITALGAAAFKDQKSITGIQLPLTLGEIPEDAFSGCSRLTSFEVPVGVTNIGARAFSGCGNLAAVVLPATLTEIGAEAFRGCISLLSLALPDTLASIGEGAFNGCSNLKNVALPANLTTISASTFKGCSLLYPTVTLPAGLTEIGASAFEGCHLTYIEIPSSCTVIGASAFAMSAGYFSAAYFDGNAPTAGDNPFPASTTLYVKPGATGFGAVPGMWMGCKTVTWVDGLKAGQHFMGAICPYSNAWGDGSYFNTGYLHNNETRIECRLTSLRTGYGKDCGFSEVYLFGGGDQPSLEEGQSRNSMAFALYRADGDCMAYHQGPDCITTNSSEFPHLPVEGCVWPVDLTCSRNGAFWTTGDSWNPDGELTSPNYNPSLGWASEGQELVIFAHANDGSTPWGVGDYMVGWFKIYESDTLVHDYRPCTDLRTGEIGFFDFADGILDSERFRAGHRLYAEKDPLPDIIDCPPDEDFFENYTSMTSVGIVMTGKQYVDLQLPKGDATYLYAGGVDGYVPADPSKYGLDQGTADEPASIKELLVFKNKVLFRHFVPCERKSDRVVGLYDLLTKAFCAKVDITSDFFDNYTEMPNVGVTGKQFVNLPPPTEGATYWYVGGIDGYEPSDPSQYGLGQGEEDEPARIRSLLVLENGEVIRYLVPCERKTDYVKGLYDLLNKTFYGNADGDSLFLPRLPFAYQEVQYIYEKDKDDYYQSGNPAIDTGYVPVRNTEISLELSLYGEATSWPILGMSYNQYDNRPFRLEYEEGNLRLRMDKSIINMQSVISDVPKDKQLFIACSITNFMCQVEGEGEIRRGKDLQESSFTNDDHLYLWWRDPTSSPRSGTKLWSCIISERDAEGCLVTKRQFVPCFDKVTNKAGLWDMVEKKFYSSNWNFLTGDNVTNR